MEYRKRCTVCGKIWCYTDTDLKNNKTNSAMATVAAIGSIASVFGGTTQQQHLNYDVMERTNNKVVDYNKCPNCGSLSTELITDEEWEEINLHKSFASTHVDINANATIETLLNRTQLLLEDKEWAVANAYCENMLDIDPNNARVYLYKLMAELKVSHIKDMEKLKTPFDDKNNYKKILRFGDDSLKKELEKYLNVIKKRVEKQKIISLYSEAVNLMETAKSEEVFLVAANKFRLCKGYENSESLIKECHEKAEVERIKKENILKAEEKSKKRKKKILIMVAVIIVLLIPIFYFSGLNSKYNKAISLMDAGEYTEAISLFEELKNYKDSEEKVIDTKYEYAMWNYNNHYFDSAKELFAETIDYKDSKEMLEIVDKSKVTYEALLAYPEMRWYGFSFNDNVNDYEKLNGEDIEEIIVGEIEVKCGSSWSYNGIGQQDGTGTIYNYNSDFKGKDYEEFVWEIKGDTLYFSETYNGTFRNKESCQFEVRRIYDNYYGFFTIRELKMIYLVKK